MFSSLRSSSMEFRRPSRDVSTPRPNQLGPPCNRQLASGSSRLDLSGLGPRCQLSVRRSVTSHWLWFPDPLRQLRWLQSLNIDMACDEGCSCQHIMGEVRNRSAGTRPPFKKGDRSWAWVTSCLLLPFAWMPACPKSPWLETFARLG
jgi:hypothetical protein